MSWHELQDQRAPARLRLDPRSPAQRQSVDLLVPEWATVAEAGEEREEPTVAREVPIGVPVEPPGEFLCSGKRSRHQHWGDNPPRTQATSHPENQDRKQSAHEQGNQTHLKVVAPPSVYVFVHHHLTRGRLARWIPKSVPAPP